MAPAPAPSPTPVRSHEDLVRGARGGTIFAALLTAGFLGGVLYQHGLAAAPVHDVAPPALSDRAATPDHEVVRVQATARLSTLVETTRGHALLALEGVPDVVVSGDATQAELSADGPALRSFVGEMQAGDEEDVGGVIEKFAQRQLHLDRARVRVLNVRGDAGTSGAGVRTVVFLVLAGLFGALTLAGVVRLLTLGTRSRAKGASR